MFTGLFILLFFPSTNGQAKDTPYECGAHGKFEYCIDGVPGCVIGCHCHPGYYFDTDSKICEPNIKLTQDYRRHFIPTPTRVQVPLITSPAFEEPLTTTSNVIDDKIDEITNDADDLGDWLYNQFFKTIENQVINNTKGENLLQTRRSGSGPPFAKNPSRRSHKYWKARKKKKKKKKNFKNKLLRITEDDSLFDSSSGSSSDDSSASSSSESESDDDSARGDTKGKNHGHKKILVVNKRPRPPLPSFIFLPNMETPFFPPIGLPPPPLPMYPMVPVPPMMAPPPYQPYPFPGVQPHIHVDDEPTTSVVSTTETRETNSAVTNGVTTEVTTTTTTTTIEETTTDGNNKDDKGEKESAEKSDENKENGADDKEAEKILRSRSKHRGGARQKLMKKLREKMKRKNKLQHFFANQYQGLEPPFLDIPPDFISDPGLIPIKNDINREELPPGMRDIDFKYLTQLIHRGNLNKTKQNLHYPPDVNQNPTKLNVDQPTPSRRNYYDTIYATDPIHTYVPGKPHSIDHNIANPSITNTDNQLRIQNTRDQPINNIHNGPNHSFNRRMNNAPMGPYNIYRQPMNSISNYPRVENNIQHRKRIEETNDTYYSNLGRQIASMIRNIEGDKEVDIEIEKLNRKPPSNPVFNENNYGSRSFWERSVRSPFEYMKSFRSEMDKLKKSNENLFSLEDEVAIAASTTRTLTLQELENVISKIDETKSRLIKKNVSRKPVEISKTSFNVNLLPGNDHPHSNAFVIKDLMNTFTEYHSPNFNQSRRRINTEPTLAPEFRNILFSNFRSLMPDIINYSTNEKNVVYKPNSTRKPVVLQVPNSEIFINRKRLLDNMKSQSQVLTNSKTMTLQPANSTDTRYNPIKPIHNQKSLNYFINNNKQFTNEKKVLKVQYPFANHYESFGQRDTPTYFHRHSRHFDYFDK